MNILITGGNGYIAKSLYQSLANNHNVTLISRDNFDLTNNESTKIFFINKFFDVVIHCAVRGGSRLKQDDKRVLDDNIKMYYNLLDNKNSYKKLIHFGSGAEIHSMNTDYGLSKRVISQSIINHDDFYNLRIYAVFDENELCTRFIKANIKNYIEKKPIEIHQDRHMSFFYMKDLIRLVDYYITNENLQKEIECCYSHVYTLKNISNMINCLDEYKVEIITQKNSMGNDYYGINNWSHNIELLGLEYGIKEVYNKLK